jgi:hypothetical protein
MHDSNCVVVKAWASMLQVLELCYGYDWWVWTVHLKRSDPGHQTAHNDLVLRFAKDGMGKGILYRHPSWNRLFELSVYFFEILSVQGAAAVLGRNSAKGLVWHRTRVVLEVRRT